MRKVSSTVVPLTRFFSFVRTIAAWRAVFVCWKFRTFQTPPSRSMVRPFLKSPGFTCVDLNFRRCLRSCVCVRFHAIFMILSP